MKVLKFGGTSVAGTDQIKKVGEVIKSTQDCQVVVVSALGGVTDNLIDAGQLAEQGDKSYERVLENLANRHRIVCNKLLEDPENHIQRDITQIFTQLDSIANGVYLLREFTPRTTDLMVSFGEKLSARILTEYLKKLDIEAEYLDSGEIIFTNDIHNGASINFEVSEKAVKNKMERVKRIQVIPGFTGKTSEGKTTTLGRGGSDLSATYIGSVLDADEVQIWTDVDGFMSADPGKVPGAFSLTSLSYDEALELSYFGAQVLLSPAIQPARDKNVPIRIKNTFNQGFPGTLVSAESEPLQNFAKGITSIDEIALITIKGSGMVGVKGISARVFSTLARADINVILISQASSEQSICVAISPYVAEKAKKTLTDEFSLEIQAKMVDSIVIEKSYSIIAIVGEKMKKTPGVAGRIFNSLGEKKINVVAIAQGSSELNISVVINRKDEVRALRAIHDEFFSETTRVNLIQVGVGVIGKELLSQIKSNRDKLLKEQNLDIRVISVANSKKMTLEPEGLDLDHWDEKLNNSETDVNILELMDTINNINLTDCILVDCTASKEISNLYEKAFKNRISVVTANKIANTGPYQTYKKLHETSDQYNVHYLYETTAGAGLPIIDTIKNLLDSGDKIKKLEAILSGTISYIFNTFSIDKNFSKVVKQAKQKGFTEPDPREDLKGTDFARKLLLLCRELGEKIEMKDLEIEPLLPESCLRADSVEKFYKELEEEDQNFKAMLEEAESQKKAIRYIASYSSGEARIELRKVSSDHPFYSLKGSDNIISIQTARYDNPLVIKGAGAGAEVTAAGLLSDIFKIAVSAKKRRIF